MYGPAVWCKGFRRSGGFGLASMYPASDWSVWAPGHHGYQRACDLLSGQASNGPLGSPVLACAGKTDPPCRLILSQTIGGEGRWVVLVIDRLPASRRFLFFSLGGRALRPRCR